MNGTGVEYIFGLTEICEQILCHLDAKARREVALICRDIYFLLCRFERNKILRLDKRVSLPNFKVVFVIA